MATARDVITELEKLKNPDKAKILSGFFKTGKGEYGEGDKFLGVTVPAQRAVAKKFKDLELKEIQRLLQSKIHEHRFTALEILVIKYERGNEKEKKEIYTFYLENTKNINNWDLVDTSARYIVGEYLFRNPNEHRILYTLTASENIWERRIAIVSTHHFISQAEFGYTIQIAELLLKDTHDLIHKAVGWMLREMGKESTSVLEEFLREHHKHMPRTMLRYSIERLPKEKKAFYMKK